MSKEEREERRLSREEKAKLRKQKAREFYQDHKNTSPHNSDITARRRVSRWARNLPDGDVGVGDVNLPSRKQPRPHQESILVGLNRSTRQQKLIAATSAKFETNAVLLDQGAVRLEKAKIPLVIDTCCIGAALVEPDSPSGQIFFACLERRITPAATVHLRSELAALLTSSQIRFFGKSIPVTEAEINAMMRYRELLAVVSVPTEIIHPELVGYHNPDIAPLQSSLAARTIIGSKKPPAVVTNDYVHLLNNAAAIKEELGIKVVSPEDWLESLAPAWLGEL